MKKKTLEEIYRRFYSPLKALSYKRPWIFCLASRSVGKSTAWAIYALWQFMKHGKKFIYCRRTEPETTNTAKKFFNNAVTILNRSGYKINEFYYHGAEFFIKFDEMEAPVSCGYAIPLSMEQNFKSNVYSDVCLIIYDEFISLDPNKYLGSKKTPRYEYDRCISLYQTVDRGIDEPYRNETIMVFLGNKASYFTPLFMALGIDEFLRTDTKICAPKGKAWLVEQVESVEAMEDIEKSFAFQLSTDDVKDYAYKNKAFDEQMNFVKKLKCPMNALGNVQYMGHKMGIYLVPSLGTVYVSNKTNTLATIALTCGDQSKINYLMATSYRDSFLMTTLRLCYMSGTAIFETNKCRYEIANYFMLTP